MDSNQTSSLVNAWIFLDEDEPKNTNYTDANSAYQRLIQKDIYQSVDILFICFGTTVPTGPTTVPVGDGSSYTITISPSSHPGGLTNQDYLNYILRDARKVNPNIQILVTLDWSDPTILSNIFSNPHFTSQENANNFANNLVQYLRYYSLNGFDIDWEPPISESISSDQFALLINAIGDLFYQTSKVTGQKYYLTLSPSEVGNLNPNAVNHQIDFLNLQLYGGASPNDFITAKVNENLLAYGAKFEADLPVNNPTAMGYQTAKNAYQENNKNYQYSIFTNWRLNSQNYIFEQTQQRKLYQYVKPSLD